MQNEEEFFFMWKQTVNETVCKQCVELNGLVNSMKLIGSNLNLKKCEN